MSDHDKPENVSEISAESLAVVRGKTALAVLAERERERVTLRDQVTGFHRLLAQPILDTPRVPPPDRVNLRLRLIAVEFEELLGACGYVDSERLMRAVMRDIIEYGGIGTYVDLIGVADALADIDFVVEGTRLEFGINGEPIAAEVSRSNNAKVGGVKSAGGKVQKPEGWTPPDIAGELLKQGWKP